MPSAWKPSNWEAMWQAYASGDQNAIQREVAIYDAEMREAGIPTTIDIQHQYSQRYPARDWNERPDIGEPR